MMCEGARKVVDLKAPVTVATFGFDERNTRTLTAAQTGLTKIVDLADGHAVYDETFWRKRPDWTYAADDPPSDLLHDGDVHVEVKL